jgi:sporulation protein YlmC with PRC-barrel domain
MKHSSNKFAPWVIAALGLALSGAPATGRPTAVCDEETAGETAPEQRVMPDQPTSFNKASRLLGMRVINQNGQRLGYIEDIVIDSQTEKVSYAVLGVRHGFLGLATKRIAVPINALRPYEDERALRYAQGEYSPSRAFRPSDYERSLVLNADKKSLLMAQGFRADDWPSVTSPSWGAAPAWKEETESSPTPKEELKTPKVEKSYPKEEWTEPEEMNPPGSLGWPGY